MIQNAHIPRFGLCAHLDEGYDLQTEAAALGCTELLPHYI